MRTLTEKECIASQVRRKDAFGNKHPYKGRWHDSAHPYPMEETELPEGWVFIWILSWGMYIRRKGDTNHTEDL